MPPTGSYTSTIDPRVVVPSLFFKASLFAWIAWAVSYCLPKVTTQTTTSIALITASQACAIASGVMVWLVDVKTSSVNDTDVAWLKSSLCAAVLSFQLGDAGVLSLFEAVVTRKQIMQYSKQRSIGTAIGCIIGSLWAVTSIVGFKSSFLASVPVIVTSSGLLYVVFAFLQTQLEPHASHSIKLQENLLKQTIRIEQQQRKGNNKEQTYFWSLDSEDLARDRPECITQDTYKSRVSAGLFTSQLKSGTSQLISGRQYQSRAGAQTYRSGVYNSSVS